MDLGWFWIWQAFPWLESKLRIGIGEAPLLKRSAFPNGNIAPCENSCSSGTFDYQRRLIDPWFPDLGPLTICWSLWFDENGRKGVGWGGEGSFWLFWEGRCCIRTGQSPTGEWAVPKQTWLGVLIEKSDRPLAIICDEACQIASF